MHCVNEQFTALSLFGQFERITITQKGKKATKKRNKFYNLVHFVCETWILLKEFRSGAFCMRVCVCVYSALKWTSEEKMLILIIERKK